MGYTKTQNTKPYGNNQSGGNVKDTLEQLKKRMGRLEAGMMDDKFFANIECDIRLINAETLARMRITHIGKFNLIVKDAAGKVSILPKQSVLQYTNIVEL